jgi:hypothetical protein
LCHCHILPGKGKRFVIKKQTHKNSNTSTGMEAEVINTLLMRTAIIFIYTLGRTQNFSENFSFEYFTIYSVISTEEIRMFYSQYFIWYFFKAKQHDFYLGAING